MLYPFRKSAWLAAAVFSASAILPAQAAERSAQVGAKLIPNQYIVTLNKAPPGDLLAGLPIAEQAQRLLSGVGGGKLLFVYEYALRGFAVRMSPVQADLLKLNPLIAGIEPDQEMHAVATQSNPTWGLDRVDQHTLPLDQQYLYPDSAGDGVHVYIVDTGLRATHTEFAGRVGAGRNFSGHGTGFFGGGSVDPNDTSDCNGHGTHVAGTATGSVYGVAKKTTVHSVRVLDCRGSGSSSSVIAGIDWITGNAVHPAVANMSLGGGNDNSLDTALRNSINSGVAYAVAAGNSNANACTGSPNRVAEAVTAGATTSADSRDTAYSNFGSCVDLFAPGTGITSAWNSSNTAANTISGTSMASPHVTGALALILARDTTQTPAQLAAVLVSETTAGVLSNIGTGSPNKLLYVASGPIEPPPPPVDNPPVASFTFSCTNLSCDFNGSGSTDDNGIASWSWDFGDSSSGNGATVSHAYSSASSYSVTLTVTDTVSQTNAKTLPVTVTAASTTPCSDCTKISGNLSSGGTAYSPSSSGFSSGGGQFKGYLRGPAGTDFDLYLQKRNTGFFGGWNTVASSLSNSSSEDIVYSGGAGTYRWRIRSISGSGAYDFYFKNP